MKEIFDEYVTNSFGVEEQAFFKFKQFQENYKKLFPVSSQANLLDIGVGRGEMLSCMKSWGYSNYLGVDISKSTIAFCQSIGLNCKLVVDTGEYLRANPRNYDLITLLDVLEHIPRENIISFLKDLKFALKPGGILIIQVPNLQAPDGQIHMFNDITHMVGFVEHSLSQVLIASGFRSFNFFGFEENISGGIKGYMLRSLRSIYWIGVRFRRKITNTPNPKILHPVLSCVIVNK
jgi:2-polyprenyl-3-methyl-5-hydroxy-6-metoxy-1,4-benzoquinol methylase